MKADKFVKSPETYRKVAFKKIVGKKISVRDLNKEEQLSYYEQKLKNLERRYKATETIQGNPDKYDERTLKRAYFESGAIFSKMADIKEKIKKLKKPDSSSVERFATIAKVINLKEE